MGFDVEDHLVSKVDYTEQKVDVEIGDHLPNHGLSAVLLNKVLTTKSKAWAAEKEHRVLAQLKVRDPGSGLYFVGFGPQVLQRSVILGHRRTWLAFA